MFLSRHNLAIHLATSTEEVRYALTGIHVDPKRNLTVASDGRCLVEIAAPPFDAKRYPAQGVTLLNGETDPFILPAKAAQEILKVLPKGKDENDVAQFAAIAKAKDGKLVIVTLDGKKTHVFPFEPVDARFPDYDPLFPNPKEKPSASITLNPEFLRTVLKVGSLGESVRFHIYGEKVVVESKSKTGLTSRSILMGITSNPVPQKATATSSSTRTSSPATAAKPAAESPAPVQAAKGAAATKSVAPEAKKSSPGGSKRSNRRWKGTKDTSTPIAVGASNAQRAFYCYLLRVRGEGRPITVKDLLAEKIAEKIEALKALPALESICATWNQWWKLFRTLLERQVEHAEICEILNGLTDIRSTSSVISEWIGQEAQDTAAAEAA